MKNTSLRFLSTLLFSIAVPAVAEVITFDDFPLHEQITSRVIQGVQFDFVPAREFNADGEFLVVGEPAFIEENSSAFSSLNGRVLVLRGGNVNPWGRAILTLTFLNGPVGAFGFQLDGLAEGHTGGTVEVFDSSNELIRTTDLFPTTRGTRPYFNASGAYRYTGVPISRVVYTVADLIIFDRSPAIDNVSFQSTPEPGSLVVVASALAGLVAIRRRLSRTS
ncbi:MAG: hypothetical protein H7039_24855 [Bryobacteraceae bacterium]|nr:hypothetical protein [Bryobacteraceae bacterium]